MKKTVILLTLFFGTASLAVFGNSRDLTYAQISAGTFDAIPAPKFESTKGGEHYTVLRQNSIVKYRYFDGQATETLFDAWAHPDFQQTIDGYSINDSETVILLTTNTEKIYRRSFYADYWIYDCLTNSLFPLSTGGSQREATVSPDGRQAAFVRDNNLYLVDLATRQERQITSDGAHNRIINGHTDWVYEEEYSFTRGYRWSPDSDAIAFYRFDESRVKSYTISMYEGQLYPTEFTYKYPKAGEENSIVQINIFNLTTGVTVPIDIGSVQDQYIPRIQWTGRPDELAVYRLNRVQNHFEVLLADATTGQSRIIYTETDPKYIERVDDQKITFLPDGKRMIVKNETSGWMHLYLYDMDGKYILPLTKGEWEVTSLDAVDAGRGVVYYTAAKQSPLGRQLYSVNLSGRKERRITNERGYNTANFSNNAKYYAVTRSDPKTPPVTILYDDKGKALRTAEENLNLKARLNDFRMPVKEFFTFTNDTGQTLYGYILKPADFDSTTVYPVFMTQYSGPGSQRVADRWGVSWDWSLVDEGYLVVCVDGRGTGFRGADFRKVTYGNLGGPETEDQIAAARYLGSLPYVDRDRIGIYGWSYGGFMALNCILKGADVFKMAIAVAPVTSWRYYDTVYTELYNGLPDENARGYDDNSPVNFAANLRGKLFIAHGTADDNVHVQNSYDMASRLVKAGKDFEMMIYPDRNHSMGEDYDDVIGRCIRFVKENL